MKLVVDNNILMGTLIRENPRLFEIFLDERNDFYAPDFILKELSKYIFKIEKKKDVVGIIIGQLFSNIKIISYRNYQDEAIKIYDIMQSIDPKDTPYVALAYKLNCPLRTNDKKLKEKINFVEIVDTDDVLNMID